MSENKPTFDKMVQVLKKLPDRELFWLVKLAGLDTDHYNTSYQRAIGLLMRLEITPQYPEKEVREAWEK